MKASVIIAITYLVCNCLGAVCYQQAINDISYWNQRFPALADSIHQQAQQYYQSKNQFAPKDEFESKTDYLLRLLNTYPEVKKHEFDPLVPAYQKMFAAYAQEVELPAAKFVLGTYEPENERFPLTIILPDSISTSTYLKLPSAQARLLKQNWNTCTKTVYGVFSVFAYPTPSRIFIQNADKTFTHSEKLAVVGRIVIPQRMIYITPVRNRTAFYIQPNDHREMYELNAATGALSKVSFPLPQNKSASSIPDSYCWQSTVNLAANRMIRHCARPHDIYQTYNARNDYYLYSYDLNLPDNMRKEILLGDENTSSEIWIAMKDCGISPGGRIILHENTKGINLYDFDNGEILAQYPIEITRVESPFSVAFDPFDKKIYTITNGETMIYNVVTKAISNLELNAKETKTDNSGLRMAYWGASNPVLSLMSFKTKDIRTYTLPDEDYPKGITAIKGVDFSPDDRLMAILGVTATNTDYRIFIYDTTNGKLLRKIDQANISSVCFTKDGQNLLSISTVGNELLVLHLGITAQELTK